MAAHTNKTVNACTNNPTGEANKLDDDDSDSDEDDLTLQGDLGESSSGFVGSSTLSSLSRDQFKLDIPVSNFPMSVSPLCYQAGLEKLPPSSLALPGPNLSHQSGEEDFSEDSLTESPGKRTRVTKRLKELAQQIDNEESLANIDSLISGIEEPVNKEIATDSLIPVRDFSSSMLEADSLEDFHVSVPLMEKQISEINDHRDIETCQLLTELEGLQQEIEGLCSPAQSRSQWRLETPDLASHLTDNEIMQWSFQHTGSGGSELTSRDSAESCCSSSLTDINISDPPRPQRASLPSPVPNIKLSGRREAGKVSGRKEAGKVTARPMVEHSGAVGVTSMWIPAASVRARPRIQTAGTNTANKLSHRLLTKTVRDNGPIGKKLQILSILPNKAEGSQSWNGRILLFTLQLMLDLAAPNIA